MLTRIEEARKANWEKCWKLMVFKDLHGYPMWESQLHDVLEPHFAALKSIFVHYCGARSKAPSRSRLQRSSAFRR